MDNLVALSLLALTLAVAAWAAYDGAGAQTVAATMLLVTFLWAVRFVIEGLVDIVRSVRHPDRFRTATEKWRTRNQRLTSDLETRTPAGLFMRRLCGQLPTMIGMLILLVLLMRLRRGDEVAFWSVVGVGSALGSVLALVMVLIKQYLSGAVRAHVTGQQSTRGGT